MKVKKDRVDLLLVKNGCFESRSRAKLAIMEGRVRVGSDHVVRNASEKFPVDTDFKVEQPFPYVSRGALKLEPALDRYLPDLADAVCLDVGASTGGFTDLMLQRGASKVYAVDVGTGQLHYKLQNDDRVVSLEKCNARELDATIIPEPVDVVTMDVSFISVKKILPAVAPLTKPGAWAFILVKPQFEAGRSEIGRGGVVRDDAVRLRVLEETCSFAEDALGWSRVDAIDSPIAGPKGNREIIAVFRTGGES
jgi:23S rRNA (cytidine1920-2'-O)/16S rRNA (cytidine1409-2'-O)-methyltransferase